MNGKKDISVFEKKEASDFLSLNTLSVFRCVCKCLFLWPHCLIKCVYVCQVGVCGPC